MSGEDWVFSLRTLALQAGFGVLIFGLNAAHTPAASLIGWAVFYVALSLLLNVLLTKMFGPGGKKKGRRV
ncbi:MAG: hypothetical protein L0H41_17345 [Microlunatus sp.]|nr:hypothetical protein [Microlunatus sp.]MDN5790315.1 hypothetical protein [Micrococcales bacterium]